MSAPLLRLVPIDRSGQPVEAGLALDPAGRDVCVATASFYERTRFVPPWMAYLAVAGDVVVGTCAFKSPPAGGEVEIAYHTFAPHEGRGIATALARQLVHLAHALDAGLAITAMTLPEANASTRILTKLGFAHIGTVADPEDGEVWKWRLAAKAVFNRTAPADKSRKYALPERERRFLLARVPQGEIVRTVVIRDRYISRTRLRLREMVETTNGATTTSYKLTQKVPAADGGPGLITTAYLTAAEHAVFAALPAATLQKTRYSIPPLGVDVFEGELEGLFIGEVEFDSDAAMHAFLPPEIAIAEVTRHPRLNGGVLVATTRAELVRTLREFGLVLS